MPERVRSTGAVQDGFGAYLVRPVVMPRGEVYTVAQPCAPASRPAYFLRRIILADVCNGVSYGFFGHVCQMCRIVIEAA